MIGKLLVLIAAVILTAEAHANAIFCDESVGEQNVGGVTFENRGTNLYAHTSTGKTYFVREGSVTDTATKRVLHAIPLAELAQVFALYQACMIYVGNNDEVIFTQMVIQHSDGSINKSTHD